MVVVVAQVLEGQATTAVQAEFQAEAAEVEAAVAVAQVAQVAAEKSGCGFTDEWNNT